MSDFSFFTREIDALDNFAALKIEIWGRTFPTAEHAYQWRKFSDSHPDIAEHIAEAGNPWEAKLRSSAHTSKLINWHDRRVSVMEEVLRAKAQQHTIIRDILNRSGDAVLGEDSPEDTFWGLGPHGEGENMMGKLWMSIRAEVTKA